MRQNTEVSTEETQTWLYKCPVSKTTASSLNAGENLLQTDFKGMVWAQTPQSFWSKALRFPNPSSWAAANPLEGAREHTSFYPEPISILELPEATGPEREAGVAGVYPACLKWRYNRETELRKTTSCSKETGHAQSQHA